MLLLDPEPLLKIMKAAIPATIRTSTTTTAVIFVVFSFIISLGLIFQERINQGVYTVGDINQ
jgi:hypothetical protein